MWECGKWREGEGGGGLNPRGTNELALPEMSHTLIVHSSQLHMRTRSQDACLKAVNPVKLKKSGSNRASGWDSVNRPAWEGGLPSNTTSGKRSAFDTGRFWWLWCGSGGRVWTHRCASACECVLCVMFGPRRSHRCCSTAGSLIHLAWIPICLLCSALHAWPRCCKDAQQLRGPVQL